MKYAKKIKAMPEKQVREILKEIVDDCIQEGRKLGMTSSEILTSVCDTLRENGLEEP